MTDSKFNHNGNGPYDLSKSPIHLPSISGQEQAATVLKGFGFDGPSFESYINDHCTTGPGRLIMVESSTADWPSWECHTKGDEIVIVLEGEAEFIQEIDGEHAVVAVGPGSAVVNPTGIWHTANIKKPMKAVYITPCDGTQHRER